MADLEDQNKSAGELLSKLEEVGKLGAASAANFKSMANELGKSASSAKNFQGQFKLAQATASSLSRSAAGLAKTNAKDLSDKKKAADFAKQAEDNSKKLLSIQNQRSVAQELLQNATGAERVELLELLNVLGRAEDEAKGLAEGFKEITQENEKLNKDTRFFDKFGDLLSKIPIIGDIFGNDFTKAAENIRKAKVEGDSFAKVLYEGSKAFDSTIFTLLATSFTKVDSSTTNLAKQLGISKEEARGIAGGFNSIAVDSGVAALNSVSLVESMIQLGDTMGATAGFTTQQVVDQTKLTQMVGLQAEEAAKLAEFGTLNGEETRSITTDILEQVALLEKETGIRLEGRKILAEVANISGQLGAQYGYNTRELARAVVQSQRLGLSLEESKNIAGNLLDFESSIVNELNAELLLGRNLNLEQARLLALQGDSAAAAAELAKQFGSAEEFTSLNVIQQQSLADAMGMSVDQLSDSIKKQQVLNTLGEKNFDQLMKTEEGRERIKNVGGEQLLQQLEQQSAAEKFQQAVVKIQTAIGRVVEGPLGSLIDGFADLAASAGGVYAIMGLIGGISLVRLIGSLAVMVAQLASATAFSISVNSALTFGLGAIAVGAAIGGLMTYISNQREKLTPMDDMIMPSGYGDRILSTPKGSIALNNQDTIVAGTNLGQGSSNQETQRTNMLLEKLITQNASKPRLSPVGLYEVQ